MLLLACIGAFEYKRHADAKTRAETRAHTEALERRADIWLEEKTRKLENLKAHIQLLTEGEPSRERLQEALEAMQEFRSEYTIYPDWYAKEFQVALVHAVQADVSLSTSLRISWWLLLFGAIGALASVGGFYLWYARLQRYLDAAYKSGRIRSD